MERRRVCMQTNAQIPDRARKPALAAELGFALATPEVVFEVRAALASMPPVDAAPRCGCYPSSGPRPHGANLLNCRG